MNTLTIAVALDPDTTTTITTTKTRTSTIDSTLPTLIVMATILRVGVAPNHAAVLGLSLDRGRIMVVMKGPRTRHQACP